MHWSLVSSKPTERYDPAVAVLVTELLKGLVSLLVALYGILQTLPRTSSSSLPLSHAGSPLFEADKRDLKREDGLLSSPLPRSSSPPLLSLSSQATDHNLHHLLTLQPYRLLATAVFSWSALPLLVPAIAYVIQNNLIYLASSNLQVGSFAVLSQMKILTTAGFSVVLLGKRLIRNQWIALALLTIGVGVVQVQSIYATGKGPVTHRDGADPVKGFLAVFSACFTSGLAGVWFEKVLKGTPTDLWVRNVQLSVFSLPPALLPVLFNNSAAAAGAGFSPAPTSIFHNFTALTWAVIFIQVAGGLLTALVIKFADNLLKVSHPIYPLSYLESKTDPPFALSMPRSQGFATSLSVLIAFTAGVFLFGYAVTPGFVVGGAVVLCATWMYNRGEEEAARSRAAALEAENASRRGSVEDEESTIALLEEEKRRLGGEKESGTRV